MTGHPKPPDDELRALLRDAAAAHRPDRTVMLNRIAQNRATGRRPRGQAIRLAGSALAVATVLGAGGVARWALADGDHPDGPAPVATAAPPSSATVAPTSSVAASVTPPAKVTTAPTTPARGSAPATPGRSDGKLGSPGHTRVEQGALWSDGSIDPDSTDTLGLSDITIKVRAPITALDVTIRVALTPGVADQGAVHDVRTARIDSTVVHEPDALIYHFVLAEGATLATGTYVFTAKYAHRKGGRDAGGDTYRARATTAAGDELDVYGNFYRTD